MLAISHTALVTTFFSLEANTITRFDDASPVPLFYTLSYRQLYPIRFLHTIADQMYAMLLVPHLYVTSFKAMLPVWFFCAASTALENLSTAVCKNVPTSGAVNSNIFRSFAPNPY